MTMVGFRINSLATRTQVGFSLVLVGLFCCEVPPAFALEVTSAEDPQLCRSIRNAIAELPPSTPMEKWPSLITMQGLSRPVWTREDAMHHLDLFRMIAGYDTRWALDNLDLNPNQHVNEETWNKVKDQWIDGIRRGEIIVESSQVKFDFPDPIPTGRSKTKLYRLGFPGDVSGTLEDSHSPEPMMGAAKVTHWKYVIGDTERKNDLQNWPIWRIESYDVVLINEVAYFVQNELFTSEIEILKGAFLPRYRFPIIVHVCALRR